MNGPSESDAVVICLTTDNHSPAVSDSTRGLCYLCAAEVWIAPSSRDLAEWFLCIDCAPGVVATTPNAVIQRPTSAQLREVADAERDDR